MKGVALGLSIVVLAALGGGAFMACRDDSPTTQACRNIPAGGCPKARGVSCTDPACQAVYLCREDQTWELERTCPPRQELPDGEPRPTPVTDSGSGRVDAAFVVPPGANGGPGCGPLQAPDCSLGTALACSSACCGCEDLFVCESGGWNTWGTCGPAGPVKSPR